ncbi:MAG: FIST C-terminal domain-containing protein [Polyangiaceae bacterium]|nr:FIST C-terminal domain-containing protein [Polyangiaceae bacterium]
MSAASFSVEATEPAALARSLREAHRAVRAPSFGLVFVTAALGLRGRELAPIIAAAWPGVPTIVAAGAGVVSDKGCHEDGAAAAGLLACGGAVAPLAGDPEEIGAQLRGDAAGRATSLLLFGEAGDLASSVRDDHAGRALLGGGTTGSAPTLLDAEGRATRARVVGVALRGLRAQVRVSSGARLLGTSAARVTAASGTTLLELDGSPALRVMTAATRDLDGGQQLLALVPGADPAAPLRGGCLRRIRGLDPERGGVMLCEPVAEGEPLWFVVADADVARADLDAQSRELSRSNAGAMPSFGLLISSSSRRRWLQGAPGADARIVRQRLEGTPFAGLYSSSELGPTSRGGVVHAHSAALGLYSVPS